MVVLLLSTLIVVFVGGYIIKILTSSSGSDLKGNSLDDFILDKDIKHVSTLINPKHKCYEKFSDDAGCQLRIVFGTEYGASEDIARLLYRKILADLSDRDETWYKHHPRIINCKNYSQLDWKAEQLILFIISTSGDGVPPTDAREFMEFMADSRISLRQLNYSVLALGDSNYPHFCKAGKLLDSRLNELGANRLVCRHDVDMENQDTVDNWFDLVLSAVNQISIDVTKDYLPQSLNAQDDLFHRHNPFYSTIISKRILTVSTNPDDRETEQVEFDLSGSSLTWQSGDALGIYPQNSTEEVLDLLEKSNLVGDEIVYLDNPRNLEEDISLKEALLKYLNLKEPSSAFIKYVKAKELNIKLSESCGEVRDILSRCMVLALTAQELANFLKPLQPRYYSISSSPVVDANTANVTVAAVRYRLLEMDRTGVCSVHLFDRCSTGTKLGVFISHNPGFRLPVNGDTDILMIGPGTGISPFMSFIAERVSTNASGKMMLYFGCRNSKDFLYKEQLERWRNEGTLELHCAFSREHPDQKIYVQHILKKHGRDAFQLMQTGGHIYICGDASHMARDVHSTLIDICATEGQLSQVEAMRYLEDMTANNRYQRDVWVT